MEHQLTGQESFGEAGLEREIGRPRAEWTVEDLAHMFRQGKARGLSLMHVGGDGWLKRLDFVPRDESQLRRICEAGERADGSNLFPGSGIPTGASDIVLRPRAESAFLDPFSEVPTLVLMCGHAGPDGGPLPQSPDTIVRRAMDRLRDETGIELLALGEVEYFLGKRRDESDIYGADDRGYHSVSPFVFGEPLRRRALQLLVDLGVHVKYGHSEVGYIEAREPDGVIWEQHEIELGLDTLPRAAEAVLLTQWVLRNLAHRSGMRCSMDPIMAEGHAGNGLHFHLAPAREGELIPVRGEDGDLSDPFRWLIGGLVQMGAALMAFGNRATGSLTRLTQAKEAPNRISWGESTIGRLLSGCRRKPGILPGARSLRPLSSSGSPTVRHFRTCSSPAWRWPLSRGLAPTDSMRCWRPRPRFVWQREVGGCHFGAVELPRGRHGGCRAQGDVRGRRRVPRAAAGATRIGSGPHLMRGPTSLVDADIVKEIHYYLEAECSVAGWSAAGQ